MNESGPWSESETGKRREGETASEDSPVPVSPALRFSGSVSSTPVPEMGPTLAAERVQAVDILRGVAVFGILVVNMMSYELPVILDMDPSWGDWTVAQWADQVVLWGIQFFAEGKFYTMFSFLFGLGLTFQMTRAKERGGRFVPMYLRRLFVLLGIGLVHAFLIWSGDILVTYALLGFPLLLFRKCRRRTLLIWALICLCVQIVIFTGFVGLMELGRLLPGEAGRQFSYEAMEKQQEVEMMASAAVYARGSVAEIMVQRARDTLTIYFYVFVLGFAWGIFAMFLLGLYAGRKGIFRDIPGHRSFIRSLLWPCLAVGVVGNLGSLIIGEFADPMVPSLIQIPATVLSTFGGPALCLFYICTIVLLAQRPLWQAWLAPIAAVGRMPLTNYLAQSVICTMIFYSYGLGLMGNVGPVLGLLLTVAIYLVEVAWSVCWMRYFQFGPMEWLWRSLTYLTPQPLLIAKSQSRSSDPLSAGEQS